MPEPFSDPAILTSELDLLFAETSWPVLMFLPSGEILAASRPMLALLDSDAETVVGASIGTFFLGAEPIQGHTLLDQIALNGTSLGVHLCQPGQPPRPIEIEAHPIPADPEQRLTLIAHPIAPARYREQRLLALCSSLPELLEAQSTEVVFARVVRVLQPFGIHLAIALPEPPRAELRLRFPSVGAGVDAAFQRITGRPLGDLRILEPLPPSLEVSNLPRAFFQGEMQAVLRQLFPLPAANFWQTALQCQGIQGVICASLRPNDTAHGVVIAWGHTLNQTDLPFVEAIARQIDVALAQIEQRRQMEARLQALQRSEQRYRVIVEQAAEAMIRLAPDGAIRGLNQTAQHMLGYTGTAIAQLGLDNLLAPATAADLRERLARLLKQEPIEMPWIIPITREDGRTIMLEVTGRVIRRLDGIAEIALIGRDATRRLEIEADEQRQRQGLAVLLRVIEAVNHSFELDIILQEGLRALGDLGLASCASIYLLDPTESCLDLRATFNVPPDLLPGLTRLSLEELPALKETLVTGKILVVDSSRLQTFEAQYPGIARLGLTTLTHAPLIVNGKPLGVFSLGHMREQPFTEWDIQLLQAVTNQLIQAVARAQMYQALQETAVANARFYREAESVRSYLNALFHNTPDVLLTIDRDIVVHPLNPDRLTVLAGYQPDEVKGQSLLRFIPQQHHEELLSRWQAALTGQPQSFEIDILKADGALLKALISAALIPDYDEIFVIIKDVTEQKQLEAQMRQTEKLAALGRLVAGAAHEINNPLAAILGLAQLQLMEDLPPELHTDMEAIERAALRVQHIVQQLRTFAQPQSPQHQPIDLAALTRVTLSRLTADINANAVEVIVDLPRGLPHALGDPHQIEQVLFNIFNNALQALASNRADLPRRLVIWGWSQEHFLHLTINDTGPGIMPEHLSRIFEPFFTTRAVGQGTGLGLSIVHAIVQQHGGRIWPESRPGYGTTFHLELPIALAVEQQTTVEPREPPKLPPGLRILLVEDEDAVRSVIARALTHLDCAVDAVSSGEEAWERALSQHYNLVISDLQMPGIDGVALYRRLHQERPLLRWLILTGDTMGEQSHAFLEQTGLPVLLKPFTHEQLLSRVVESLTDVAE